MYWLLIYTCLKLFDDLWWEISWPSLHVDKCRCNSQPMLGTKHDHVHPFVARFPAICRLFRPVNHDEPCCMFKCKSRCIFVQATWLRQILEQVKSGATWILNPVEWVTWMMIEFKPQLENYYLNFKQIHCQLNNLLRSFIWNSWKNHPMVVALNHNQIP